MTLNKQDFNDIKNKLSKSSVGIAGLGGLGSNAAISLARLGIGRLVLVDFDIIEKENLDRQYYFIDQIGMKKIEAMKQNIEKINPKIKLELYNLKLQKGSMSNIFNDVDVIIEALDEAKIKTEFIEEIMNRLPDKYIVAASGVTGFGNSDRIKTKKFGKLFLCYDDKALSIEEDILYAPRVSLIANWEANLAIEIILSEKYES
jgi:sulfur carrier protein ThiS adenylyltransferase